MPWKGNAMDLQTIADSFFAPTCVLSVEKTDNRHYGEIRITAGNRKFIDTIEHPAYAIDGFTPGDESPGHCMTGTSRKALALRI